MNHRRRNDNPSRPTSVSTKREKLGTIFLQTLGFFAAVFAVYALIFAMFGDKVEAAGSQAAERFGYAGVFAFVYLVDAFIVPATADLLFPFTLSWPPIALLSVMSAASVLGGFTGFLIARRLAHVPFIQRSVAYYRVRGEALIARYGAWAVVLAALTPVPYSTVSWLAGMLKVSPKTYLIASLGRFPRFFLYYAIIKAGWLLGGSFAPGT